MIKGTSRAIASASKTLFNRWGTLLVLVALHLGFITALYLFFLTREATIGQVIATAALLVAAAVLFFVMQTVAARYTVEDRGVWRLLLGAFRDFWKLFVVAIPVIIVAVLILLWAGGSGSEAGNGGSAGAQTAKAVGQAGGGPLNWGLVAVRAIEYLVLLLILPLIAIQLWLSSAREGLTATVKSLHRSLGKALAPDSVITYAAGFLMFALAPYLLIITKTPAGNAWVEGTLLGTRLVVAALLSIVSWTITVGGIGALGSAVVTGAATTGRQAGDAGQPATL